MKLEHFHYLLEINRLQSISAAARALHIRQTTLSAIVKAVEEEVGFPIFQRAPTGVVATPTGERLMALAWEINVKYEELLSLKQYTFGGSQAIKVLMAPTIAISLPVPLASRFYKFELRGNLAFEECHSAEIYDRLTGGAANIGVAFLTPQQITRLQETAERDQIIIERLLMDQIYLLVAKTHPFADMETISANMIRAQRLASTKSTRDDAILGRYTLDCARITTFSDVDTLLQAVLEQNMVTFLPGYSVFAKNPEEAAQYHVITVQETEKENRLFLCLLRRNEHALRYQEKIVASCIREHFWDFLGYHPEFAPPEEGGSSK